MGDLQELIERLENASGPDPYLDEDIREFFWKPSIELALAPYNYTASLDSAVGLVERMLRPEHPGMTLTISGRLDPRRDHWKAEITWPSSERQGYACNPAIALLIALCRSLPRPGDANG